jgi:hypothetical protein
LPITPLLIEVHIKLRRFIIKAVKLKKKAVIDIDNTLWHFCDALYGRLKNINRAMPAPHDWIEWDFWENYCSKEEFLGAIDDIHLNQDDETHLPYPEARDFLSTLKENDFHIIIASHRISESGKQTNNWLIKHDLVFDELHLSHDKTVLFEEMCHVVVDDAPHVLEKAKEKGVISTGLLFPWNMKYKDKGHRLFKSLDEILSFILDGSSNKASKR